MLDEPLSGLDPLVRDEVVEGLLGQAEEMTILISSHELTEIEGLATHVAFMEEARLKFNEPIEDLRARFRHVSATFAAPPPFKAAPANWLSVNSRGASLDFVDSHYVGEAGLAAEVAARVGAPERLESTPLSLREISKALMRASRKEVEA